MKDAKGHGSEKRGAHAAGIDQVGREPLTMYHGSRSDFDQFRGRGVWLAEHPETAVNYAEQPTPNRVNQGTGPPMLYEATVGGHGNMAAEKDWDATGLKLGSHEWSSFSDRFNKIAGKLKAAGYDGVHFNNHTTYVFNPKHVKIMKKTILRGGSGE